MMSGAPPCCPCCAFLSDDLFLPPPSKEERSLLTTNSSSSNDRTTIQIPTPEEALNAIRADPAAEAQRLVLVDTHTHPQLERNVDGGDENDNNDSDDQHDEQQSSTYMPQIIIIVCAVSPEDWRTTLSYASDPSRYETTLPGLGVHPWYLYPDLSPTYLSDLEALLMQHPRAILGEIGLCKVAKFVRNYPAELGGKHCALELQRTVFRDQFQLAARLDRPVSVHCVQQHGVLIKMFKEIKEVALRKRREWRKTAAKAQKKGGGGSDGGQEPKVYDAFPPAIAMHSYTGTAHHVKELLAFEETLTKEDKSSSNDAHRPLFYFGFSHAVNVVMCSSDKSRLQNMVAIRAVPTNRLLAESDVHCTADVATGTAGAIAYLAAATGGSVVDMAYVTAKNGVEFLHSVLS